MRESDPTPTVRPLGPALRRGWARRCPHCGTGAMMDGYLNVRVACPVCGEALHHHRADDLPAWATILIVGHVFAVLVLAVEQNLRPALWVHYVMWPVLVLGLSLWLLPRIKGAVVAMQWAWRMHGFGGDP